MQHWETMRVCVPHLNKENPEVVHAATAVVIRNKSFHEDVSEEMARPTQDMREPLETL